MLFLQRQTQWLIFVQLICASAMKEILPGKRYSWSYKVFIFAQNSKSPTRAFNIIYLPHLRPKNLSIFIKVKNETQKEMKAFFMFQTHLFN